MKTSMKLLLATSLALGIGSAANAAVIDDFNRADAGTLGSGWTQQVGTSSISGNQATGTNLSLATYNGGSGNTVSFDVTDVGTSTQYIAAVLGYGTGDNYFIKVQNNGGTQGFGNYAFYSGNNGGGFFGTLSSPFLTGHVEASFVGTLATLMITPTGGPVQTYTNTYGAAPTGTGIGLGFFGAALADNFGGAAIPSGVPEPETWALMILGFGLVGGAMRRRQNLRVTYA
jgi:hypothetical protein